jgi:hypothetical protein
VTSSFSYFLSPPPSKISIIFTHFSSLLFLLLLIFCPLTLRFLRLLFLCLHFLLLIFLVLFISYYYYYSVS